MISTILPGIMTGHTGPVYSVAPGRSQTTLFSGASDGYIVEWNYEKLAQEGLVVRVPEPVFSVFHDQENQLILAGTGGGKIHVIDVQSGREVRCLDYHTKGIFGFYLNIDRNELYVPGGDGILSVWSWPDMNPLRQIQITSSKCRQIAVMPDSKDHIVGTSDGKVVFCNVETGELSRRFTAHEKGLSSLALHPTKPTLLTGGRDAHLNVWNLSSNNELLVSIPAHNFAIYSIQFCPNSSLMATASRDKTIKVWDAQTLDLIHRLDAKIGGHTRSVNQLRWLSDQLFASCGDDGKIIVWKLS